MPHCSAASVVVETAALACNTAFTRLIIKNLTKSRGVVCVESFFTPVRPVTNLFQYLKSPYR
jgi:hypothetical protein